MNAKKVNWLYLSMVLFEAAIFAFFVIFGRYIYLGVIESLLISQAIILIPTVLFLVITRTRPSQLIPLRKMRFTSIILTVVVTYLFFPLIITANAFSMLFVDNEVNQLNASLEGLPLWAILLIIGIFGPLSEEFCFRGVIYHGYRRSGRIVGAVLLSALLFGVTHLNFNQMSYAIIVGICCAALIECTGNIISAMLFHIIINTTSTVMSYFSDTSGLTQAELEAQIEMTSHMSYREAMSISVSIYLMISLVTVTIAICLMYVIAKSEGRIGHLKSIWPAEKQNRKKKLISVPLLIALLICFAYMIFDVMMQFAT